MAGIWTRTGTDWKPAAPQTFPDEATLHEIVAENPQLLPLAGSPRLIVLGREVGLANGFVDVLAVETSGRPAIIEVKLARNSEARRAVVSQVLAYAAFLRGYAVEELQRGPLDGPLQRLGFTSLEEAVEGQDQEGAVDFDSFRTSLQRYLNNGQFRLVLVLDDVSSELERIVGYLDSVTMPGLTIDLVTVSVYEVGGTQVALPQRISPDPDAATETERPRPTGRLSDGPQAFIDSVADISGPDRKVFDDLIAWATEVEQMPNVRLASYVGIGADRITLLPRLIQENAGLITIWNDNGRPYISLWRSVFERRAPDAIGEVEDLIAPKTIGQGNTLAEFNSQVLAALKRAYEEAAGGNT